MTPQNQPQQPPCATYYIVPVITQDGGTETVRYFQEVKGKDFWTEVDAKNLNSVSEAQDYRSDFVCLVQPSEEEITAHIPNPPPVDYRVTLFSGVAKTLNGETLLPNMYAATLVGGRPSIVLSVFPGKVRGLILVFIKKPDSSDSSKLPELIATSDPQIINSTN